MSNTVNLTEMANAFIVTLNEGGKLSKKEFEAKSYAISWATGQAVRLKCLVRIARVDLPEKKLH